MRDVYEQMALLHQRLRATEERIKALEKATGQDIMVTYDPTCGGIHPPYDEMIWPDHCHVRHCPRCGRHYPI